MLSTAEHQLLENLVALGEEHGLSTQEAVSKMREKLLTEVEGDLRWKRLFEAVTDGAAV